MTINDNDIQFQFEHLLMHVVFPRVLPHENYKDHERYELTLISRLNETIKEISDFLPSETVRFFASFNDIHNKMRTPDNISEKINALKPGDTFAVFVRRQNCAFLIHMPDDSNDVIVYTFPGNLHLKEIYGNAGDLQVTK